MGHISTPVSPSLRYNDYTLYSHRFQICIMNNGPTIMLSHILQRLVQQCKVNVNS